MRITLAKIITALAVLAAASSIALAQGGCTAYHLWTAEEQAGDEFNPPPTAKFLEDMDACQAANGGIGPSCSYTWIPWPWPPPTGAWEGVCYSLAYRCSTTPLPPAGGGGGAGGGPGGGGGCGGNPSGNPNEPTCGEPINLTTGDTYIQQTDLVIPGLGGGLRLVRTWNSMWPQGALSSGLFGNNWRSTYEESIFVGSDGTVKYARSDGSVWSFLFYSTPTQPLQYGVIAPANAQATLTEQGTTTWTLTFQNGEQRIFNYNSGSLTTIIDRNGNQTLLAYDASNRLTSVTDPASRHLYFSYASPSSSLVVGVTSDVGLSLSYAYDNLGRLTTVTNPDQTNVSFVYNNSSLITAVTDTNGIVLESHTYDSNGRGLTSSRANAVRSVTVSYGQQ